jgi:hypothetical protein
VVVRIGRTVPGALEMEASHDGEERKEGCGRDKNETFSM